MSLGNTKCEIRSIYLIIYNYPLFFIVISVSFPNYKSYVSKKSKL